MDTKSCAYCHTMQPVDARICRMCGYPLNPKLIRRASRDLLRQEDVSLMSPHQEDHFSASSHLVGHYSGLHPEDQPYQSRIMQVQSVQKETERLQRHTQLGPERIVFPSSTTVVTRRERSSGDLKPQQRIRAPKRFLPWRLQLPHGRFVSLGLALACIMLLLTASLTTFMFLHTHPSKAMGSLQVMPDKLRNGDLFTLLGHGFSPQMVVTFTHDNGQSLLDANGHVLSVSTDKKGEFSVTVPVPQSWSVGVHRINVVDDSKHIDATIDITIDAPASGPPALVLYQAEIDFPSAASGVVSSQDIVLNNNGGGKVVWQESSDQPWLKSSPASGTFAGSQQAEITVNRGNLKAGTYHGHITFTQKDKENALQVLSVSMVVDSTQPVVSLSATSLTFAVGQTYNPLSQVITLQNNSTQPLTWSGSTTTQDTFSWLHVQPEQGLLQPGQSQVITASVRSAQLATGNYQGSIDFNGGTTAQVSVGLTVVSLGKLAVSPQALDFTTNAGQTIATQDLTLQNSGGSTLDWTVDATTQDNGSWLSTMTAQGSMASGEVDTIPVNIDSSSLQPGSYQGLLTFTSGGATSEVSVSLTVVPDAGLSVQNTTLSFVADAGVVPSAQQDILMNKGSNAVTWSTSVQGGVEMAVSPAQGVLQPGQSVTLAVSITGGTASSGTQTGTITVAGAGLLSRQIAVQLKVQSQDHLHLSQSSIAFSMGSAETQGSQPITLQNTGSDALNWQIIQSSNAAGWLSIDGTSGQLASGASTVVIVDVDSSSLSSGTYTAQLQINDSSNGSQLATIPVTLTVQ